MRILFIRHGEPDYALDCLTALGRVQARAAAVRLREEGIEEIWSSPLGRARETAEATAEELGLPVRILDFMREVTWGSIDGTPLIAGGHPWFLVNEMARQGVDLNMPDWRDSSFFQNNRVVECIDRVETGIDGWLAGFGYTRKGAYYSREAEEQPERTVALFSHGGSSSAAMGHILSLPFPYACGMFHPDHTEITVLRLDGRAGPGMLPRLELMNDAKHIQGAKGPGDTAEWK